MVMHMSQTKNAKLFLLWMIILFIYGATIFLTGFFPINNYSVDHDTIQGRPQSLDELGLTPPAQLYGQTILMIVDALRSDFPTSNTMPFSSKNACSRLKLRVNIPTVTMPRLKSLTTGTVSNFIDIILNIGHVEKLSDSLLHRLQERNETIVFAGDRTWISLFPKQFRRFTANVDSFFVNDFYEGDKNVTEVLSKELEQSDWMFFVLHYLGLDHIGHVEGSDSSKIPGKLKEMDEVVQKIYTRKHLHRQLLLLTGDHGMRDGGGHGGSTNGEMYVPLYIFKETCITQSTRSTEYNQIDIAPTLAILWALEIPPMSIGCLIPELLNELSFEDQLYAYYYNALHLVRKVHKKLGPKYMDGNNSATKWFETAKSAHKQFLLTKRNNNFDNAYIFEDAKVHYLRLSREISDQLSESLVQFDYGLISIGLMLDTLVVLQTLTTFYKPINFIGGKGALLSIFAFSACINKWCHYQHYITTTGTIGTLALLLAIATSVYFIINLINIFAWNSHSWTDNNLSLTKLSWTLLGCLIFHTTSLASSSYIENEEKTWFYLGTSTLILLSVQCLCINLWNTQLDMCCGSAAMCKVFLRTTFESRTSFLVICGLGIFGRLSCITSHINQENAKPWLSCAFAAGLALFLLCLRQHAYVKSSKEFALYTLTAILTYCYRAAKGSVYFTFDISFCDNSILNILGIVICCATCLGLLSVLQNSKRRNAFRLSIYSKACFRVLLNFLLTISMMLHKPHNAALVACLIYTLSISYKMCDKLESKTLPSNKKLSQLLCTILVANMFYFFQGNSNSFATIDLNPGYIGQTTFNPIIVGILVTINMYSAHFIAFVYLIAYILHEGDDNSNESRIKDHINFILYFYTLSIFVPVLIYFWLLLCFRYHLFIYSVFAPKALYEWYRVIVLFLTFSISALNLYIFDV